MVKARCILCSEPMLRHFSVPCDYRRPAVRHKYQVFWCKGCGFGQVLPRPSPQDVLTFYDVGNYYTHAQALDRRGKSRAAVQSFVDRLCFHLAWRMDRTIPLSASVACSYLRRTPSRVCEIGCGNGRLLGEFAEMGVKVCGVEPDAAARGIAGQALRGFGSLAVLHEGTAEAIPDEVLRSEFDIIIMSHVLEHCLDVDAALRNCRRLISPAGLLIVEVPNSNALGFQRYRGVWPWADIPRHLNFFTPPALREVIQKAGFRSDATEFQGFARQFSNEWLNTEEKIATCFGTETALKLVRRWRRQTWMLLLRSLVTPRASTYDSMRVVARPV